MKPIISKSLITLILCLFLVGNSLAEVIYVDADAKGLNNGNSWTDAYLHLQSALLDATAYDEIWVAEGTYNPTYMTSPPDPRSATFRMKNNVEIYGGFDPGSGITTFKQRNWATYQCILSGDIGVKGDSSDNCYHVIYHSLSLGLNHTAILDGFIITKGQADGVGFNAYGGGMYNYGNSPGFINCSFIDNYGFYGGAVYNNANSNTGFLDCVFEDNFCIHDGGAVLNESSSPTFNGCVFGRSFYENTAYDGGAVANSNSGGLYVDCEFVDNRAELGGAIYDTNSAPTIIDCEFRSNIVQGASFNCRGGAIAEYNNSSASVSGGLFTYNVAVGDAQGKGGAVYCDSTSSPNFSEVRFESNFSHDNGGAIYCDGGNTLIDYGSILIGNSADNGGAIYCTNGSTLSVVDCNIFYNIAHEQGGGIYSTGSSPGITDCNIVGNEAAWDGGGIAYLLSSGGTVSRSNITGNETTAVSKFGGGIFCSASSPTILDCNISYNQTSVGGGIGCVDSASIEMSNCFIRGNIAREDGGGVSIGDSSSAELINCMIVDNNVLGEVPGYGLAGGIGVVGTSDIIVKNCTIANNTSKWSPGGIYSFLGAATVTNSIIYGNTGTDISGDAITVTYSDIEGGYSGSGNIDADPCFVNPAMGDYHLWPGSPCIDRASNAAAAGITTDIDGENRILDGDGDETATVDMGADEAALVVVVWVDDDYTSGGFNDGHTWDYDAFAVIQDGIDNVSGRGTVHVAAGGYTENLSINKNVDLVGAGAMLVTVDGGMAGAVIEAEGVDSDTRIGGMTITNGSGHDYGGFTGGGGVFLIDSNLILHECIIAGNTAMYGGAMENEAGSQPTVVNCLIYNNTATFGGAIGNYSYSTVTIHNSTITENTASGSMSSDGGAIFNEINSSADIKNSILWANSPNEIANDATSSALVAYTDIQGGYAGSGNLNVNPMFINEADSNYRLDPNSACVESGMNSYMLIPYIKDIDGWTRVAAKSCNINPTIDRGAYEFNRYQYGDFSDDCEINFEDYAMIFEDWGMADTLRDIYPPWKNGTVNLDDLAVLCEHWLEVFE